MTDLDAKAIINGPKKKQAMMTTLYLIVCFKVSSVPMSIKIRIPVPEWLLIILDRPIMNPEAKANQARALLAFLSDAVTAEKNPYGEYLKTELEKLNKVANSYIIHEMLEGYNVPCYFHEFVNRASRNELQYLGEAEFNTMLVSNFSPKVNEALKGIKNNLIATEQYMDFLRNRTFRQTFLIPF